MEQMEQMKQNKKHMLIAFGLLVLFMAAVIGLTYVNPAVGGLITSVLAGFKIGELALNISDRLMEEQSREK